MKTTTFQIITFLADNTNFDQDPIIILLKGTRKLIYQGKKRTFAIAPIVYENNIALYPAIGPLNCKQYNSLKELFIEVPQYQNCTILNWDNNLQPYKTKFNLLKSISLLWDKFSSSVYFPFICIPVGSIFYVIMYFVC